MYVSNASKILAGIAFVNALALVTPTAIHAQVARSYCLRGSRLPPQCGFPTIPQCLNQGAGYGICNPSDGPPDPYFAGVSANAKMIMSVPKRDRATRVR